MSFRPNATSSHPARPDTRSREARHGEGYQYSHNAPGGWVDQEYLPEQRQYYEPTDRGYEATIKARLDDLRRSAYEHPRMSNQNPIEFVGESESAIESRIPSLYRSQVAAKFLIIAPTSPPCAFPALARQVDAVGDQRTSRPSSRR